MSTMRLDMISISCTIGTTLVQVDFIMHLCSEFLVQNKTQFFAFHNSQYSMTHFLSGR